MENDVRLQEGHPVDENLRPIKVGGKATALETAQHGNGARVNGDLEVTGNIKGNVKDVELDLNKINSTDLTIDDSGDISLDADGGEILLKDGGTEFGRFSTALSTSTLKLFESAGSSNDDLFTVAVGASGSTTISTTDAGGTGGDLTMNIDGDIVLNSDSGVFEMKNADTKFADMYAGMILGYTVIGLDVTPATYAVTNAMVPTHDDHKVSFVFPPSGKVEIFASIYVDTNSARPLTFGLSTTNATTGFTSLGAKYENHTWFGDETDGQQHSHRWYITGAAGDSEELWLSAGTTHTGTRYNLRWGGDSSAVADGSEPYEYQPFVMKATALPATIYTG